MVNSKKESTMLRSNETPVLNVAQPGDCDIYRSPLLIFFISEKSNVLLPHNPADLPTRFRLRYITEILLSCSESQIFLHKTLHYWRPDWSHVQIPRIKLPQRSKKSRKFNLQSDHRMHLKHGHRGLRDDATIFEITLSRSKLLILRVCVGSGTATWNCFNKWMLSQGKLFEARQPLMLRSTSGTGRNLILLACCSGHGLAIKE